MNLQTASCLLSLAFQSQLVVSELDQAEFLQRLWLCQSPSRKQVAYSEERFLIGLSQGSGQVKGMDKDDGTPYTVGSCVWLNRKEREMNPRMNCSHGNRVTYSHRRNKVRGISTVIYAMHTHFKTTCYTCNYGQFLLVKFKNEKLIMNKKKNLLVLSSYRATGNLRPSQKGSLADSCPLSSCPLTLLLVPYFGMDLTRNSK